MKTCKFCQQQCADRSSDTYHSRGEQYCKSCNVEYYATGCTNLVCYIDDIDYRLQLTNYHIAIIGGLDVRANGSDNNWYYYTLNSIPDNINPDNVKNFIQRILKLKAFL